MSEPFIGEIIMFGGNFAPRGWALCDGQLLAIASNTALFSILGTTYGGDGRTTFGLPDLRGRVAIHAGSGPGLSPRTLGEKSGSETTTLTVANMASHNHSVTLHGESAAANTKSPTGAMLAFPATEIYAAPVPADEKLMAADSIKQQNVGSGTPFNNIQPFNTVNFIIALQGVFPSRS